MLSHLGEKHRWIHIAITVANPGKTLLVLGTGTIRIQQINPLDSNGTSALANAIANGNANLIVSKGEQKVIWPMAANEYSLKLDIQIEPGESDTSYYEFVIPVEIKTIKVHSAFSERETGWFWRIYRRIVNPDRESLLWIKNTIYDVKP